MVGNVEILHIITIIIVIVTMSSTFYEKTMYIHLHLFKQLQIWDTTGQERFRSLTTGYYRNAHAALVVYDITSKESLLNCDRWMNDVKMHSGHDIPNILLGN